MAALHRHRGIIGNLGDEGAHILGSAADGACCAEVADGGIAHDGEEAGPLVTIVLDVADHRVAVALEGASVGHLLGCRHSDSQVGHQRGIDVVLPIGLRHHLGELRPIPGFANGNLL